MLIGKAANPTMLPGATLFDGLTVSINTSQNDFTTPGLPDASSVLINCQTAANLTGLRGAIVNRIMVLENIGTANLTLLNASGASLAANRFNLGANIIMTPGSIVTLIALNVAGVTSWWLFASSLAGTGTGSGTVTSISVTVPDDFTVAVATPTTTPAISISHAAMASAAPAAGASNNFNPGGGWPVGFDRLDLTCAAASNLTGLVAGQDGQRIIILNDPASAANLTLNNQNALSTAANRFLNGGADLVLPPGQAAQATYFSALGYWVLS